MEESRGEGRRGEGKKGMKVVGRSWDERVGIIGKGTVGEGM